MIKLPGFNSLKEFALHVGLNYKTVTGQMTRGKCAWPPKLKLGQLQHPLYTTWYGIKQRCYNTRASNYERYGGRDYRVPHLAGFL